MLVSVYAVFISCFPLESSVAAGIISSLSQFEESVDRWLTTPINRCKILCFVLLAEKVFWFSSPCKSFFELFQDMYNSSIQRTCLSSWISENTKLICSERTKICCIFYSCVWLFFCDEHRSMSCCLRWSIFPLWSHGNSWELLLLPWKGHGTQWSRLLFSPHHTHLVPLLWSSLLKV